MKAAGNGGDGIFFDPVKRRWRCLLSVRTGEATADGHQETYRVSRTLDTRTEARAWVRNLREADGIGQLLPEDVRPPGGTSVR